MKTLKTTIDVAALIAGGAVSVGGAVSAFNSIKGKKGATAIAGGILVALVGIYATKHALESIRKKD